MIGYLAGKLISKENGTLLIDVNGVGYNVHIPLSSQMDVANEGENVSIYIYTNVRDNEIKLFGFMRKSERECFEKLTGVSGIGPKIALNVLSNVTVENLVNSIELGDFKNLSNIPGIGSKTAQRLVIELKGKLIKFLAEKPKDSEKIRIDNDVISAMVNLGYAKGKIEDILAQIGHDKNTRVEDLIREVLRRIK